MDNTAAVCTEEFFEQAQKTVALAFFLCEQRITANQSCRPQELRALSAAALALKTAVDVFSATERLSR